MKMFSGMDKNNVWRATVCSGKEEARLILGRFVPHIHEDGDKPTSETQTIWDAPRSEFIDTSNNGQWTRTEQPPLVLNLPDFTDWQLDTELHRVNVLHGELTAQLREIERKVRAAQRFNMALSRERAVRKARAGEKVDWGSLLAYIPGDATPADDALSAALACFEMYLDAESGYSPVTVQRCVAIKMAKDNSRQVDLVARGLSDLLPHLKSGSEGLRRVRVLTRMKRTKGKVWLSLTETGGAQLTGGGTKQVDFQNLRAALSYVQTHHYYEDASDSPATVGKTDWADEQKAG